MNALVELCHATARRYGVRFGVAPVGTPSRTTPCNTATRARWLRQGTVDYLMPQLYWGQEYVKDGDTSHSLARLAGAWAALPRAAGVRLYAGLGAYRIGAGDGSDAGSEWASGRALADQLNLLDRLGVQGRACTAMPACLMRPTMRVWPLPKWTPCGRSGRSTKEVRTKELNENST